MELFVVTVGFFIITLVLWVRGDIAAKRLDNLERSIRRIEGKIE